jgi:hypothetical protein
MGIIRDYIGDKVVEISERYAGCVAFSLILTVVIGLDE